MNGVPEFMIDPLARPLWWTLSLWKALESTEAPSSKHLVVTLMFT